MHKLKLDVDALQVESFMIRSPDGETGTVHARGNGTSISIPLPGDDSTGCDGGGWGSLLGTCEGCPTVGTCVGPTYCCRPTWRPTCNPSCDMTCPGLECGV